MHRRTLKKMLLCFFLPPVAGLGWIIGVNAWFEKQARLTSIESLNHRYGANAIKHAYAANLLYASLRRIGFPEASAEKNSISLGIINEYAEIILKLPSRRDSTLESMKDLYNNYVGIKLAQRLESCLTNKNNPHLRLEMTGHLANRHILLLHEKNVPLPAPERTELAATSSPAQASRWFTENRLAFSAALAPLIAELSCDTQAAGQP